VGEGVVEFAGWQNGYGKVLEVRHGNERTTVYAHLSAMNVKKGDHVTQGQHIGAVGNTGWSTGPHLHFEFRLKGMYQDPLQVAKAAESLTLDGASRAKFAELAKAMQAQWRCTSA
jgi:murein DD-endopeptidase MepM/ murein hydrolase activator NlpD